MKYFFSLAIIFLFYCNIRALESSFNNLHKSMLIFLDDSEHFEKRGIRAIYTDLISAIAQKVGPILASSNLLATIANRYVALHENGKPIDWANKHYRATIIQRPNDYDYHDLLLEASKFNPEEWLIKKVNNFLHLLVPKTYIENSGFTVNDFNDFKHSREITDLELKAGILLNHMETVEINSIQHQYTSENYFLEAIYNEKTKKSSIFCLNSDYYQRPANKPIWSLCITGHGSIAHMITNLSLQSFKKFLDFLSAKITTSLLVYVSCYAAGLNEKTIYSDAESAIQKTYPYAIITKALTDAPTNVSRSATERVLTTDIVEEKVVFRHPYSNYIDFVTAVTNSPYDYKKIALKLFQDFSPSGRLSNTPQIKLPGTEWFSVIASNKNVFSIHTILTKTRTNPLNISKFTKAQPKAVLLYAPYIPFELILDSAKLEAIISMLPGNATHYINKIKSNTSLIDVLNFFSSITMLGVRKQFIIHEIDASGKFGDTYKAKNVVIYNSINDRDQNPDVWKALFGLNDKIYAYQKPATMYTEASREELANYGARLREGQMVKQQFITFDLQNFNISEKCQLKMAQNALLLENYFTLENALRILSAV